MQEGNQLLLDKLSWNVCVNSGPHHVINPPTSEVTLNVGIVDLTPIADSIEYADKHFRDSAYMRTKFV